MLLHSENSFMQPLSKTLVSAGEQAEALRPPRAPRLFQHSGSGRQGLLHSRREGKSVRERHEDLKKRAHCTIILASQESHSLCRLSAAPGSPRTLHALSSCQEVLFGGGGREKKITNNDGEKCLDGTCLTPGRPR